MTRPQENCANRESPAAALLRISACLNSMRACAVSPLEQLSGETLPEKLISLVHAGPPLLPPLQAEVAGQLQELAALLGAVDTSQLKVVVFGGGTGLATIIGGDSRSLSWRNTPFLGLKELFPKVRSIVCTTDDGGSTGELLKDFPLIGLGDIRHVMLSSIQKRVLCERYGLDDSGAVAIAHELASLFNYRFDREPGSLDELLTIPGLNLHALPAPMHQSIVELIAGLFNDPRLRPALCRPHCLGNLLIISAIYQNHAGPDLAASPAAIRDGLRFVGELIGVRADGVLPCTTTPSVLKIRYANGVAVTGESKVGAATRDYPVEQVRVGFSAPTPYVLPEVMNSIASADIILFAPGSLYTSIVPILQVPGISEAVRNNVRAIKILVGNFWVQSGETDLAIDAPERRFYVSDLIKAYHRNIAGGINGLIQHIMLHGLRDIAGSILQRYAVEGKIPIFLDKAKIREMGVSIIEANIFSKEALARGLVRHDARAFSEAVKTIWGVREHLLIEERGRLGIEARPAAVISVNCEVACHRYRRILKILPERGITDYQRVADILWRHRDIPIAHLDLVSSIQVMDKEEWARSQEWDNVFSFYDPNDRCIKIREDMAVDGRYEVAFLVALGQSLLGNYAFEKRMEPLVLAGETVGKVYHLLVRPGQTRQSFFTLEELICYLTLARMRQDQSQPLHFTRVLNSSEGFTPPGLLFGLTYAWYLDNRFASHIEYKMAIARTQACKLVPEQVRTQERRRALIDFFRQVVFRQNGD